MPKQQLTTKTDDELDFSKYEGRTGAEGIEDRDITIPRLKIGQSLSDEVKSGQVKEGALFLNIDPRPLWTPGEHPVPCHIVAQTKDYVLWRDRLDNDGGILARAAPVNVNGGVRYKWDKPNQTFETMLGGRTRVVWKTKTYTVELGRNQRLHDPEEDNLASWGTEWPENPDSPPAAKANHTYLVLLPTAGNSLALMSLTRTGVSIARKLNSTIRAATADGTMLPMLKFNLSTFVDNSGLKPFMNWVIQPNGWLTSTDRKVALEDRPLAKVLLAHFDKYEAGAYTAATQLAAPDSVPVEKEDEIPF